LNQAGKVFEPVSCRLFQLACEAYLRCVQSEAQRAEKINRATAELEAYGQRMKESGPDAKKKYETARQKLMEYEVMIQPDAVAAVILAVATLEGFINELTEYSRWDRNEWGAWGEILYEAEKANTSTRLKYLLAAFCTGQPFDKGAQPCQDFDLLIGLRDVLVHPHQLTRIEDGSFKTTKVMKSVLRRVVGGAAFDLRYRHHDPGYNEICSTDVAEWACKTASAMIHALRERLPDGGTKQAFEMIFCTQRDGPDWFQPVDASKLCRLAKCRINVPT
jgi:hypothetical protein